MQILLLLLLLTSAQSGYQVLEEIPRFGAPSFFKKEVYTVQDTKIFYASNEVKQLVDPANPDIHLMNAALFYATNHLREKKGLKACNFSEPLRDAAMLHTYEMVKRNFFDHYNRKNRTYYSPENRFQMFGLRPSSTAENIDLDYVNMYEKQTYLQVAERIVDALYHSKEHRINMLNKTYTQLGCAVYFESKPKNGVWYLKATQDFAGSN